jgi:hypothetical protein
MCKDDRNVIQSFHLYLAYFDFLHAGEDTRISVFGLINERTSSDKIEWNKLSLQKNTDNGSAHPNFKIQHPQIVSNI